MYNFLKPILIIFTIFISLISYIWITTPSAKEITRCLTTFKYKVYLCEKSPHYVKLNQISRYMKDLVIISEDNSFYSHTGFDLSEMKKSFDKNLHLTKFARGGSTITQQLAKNVFLPFDKSITRKIREALLAREIEGLLSKDKILEKYLNVIEFGPGLYGIKNASFYYFKKSPSQLNLLESAFLVYLIPNPKVHARIFNKGEISAYAKYRILDLSYRMFRFRKINSGQYQAVKNFVDEFPWHSLSGEQVGALAGIVLEKEETVSHPLIAEPLEIPESDENIEPVAAPPEEDTELEEDINKEL